ncbi:MAG: winged helix-turn-helix domain-containing protein [Candidatus Bathyarchaeota archaeon]|nr:winged helix-turn-helix domain-containing protein [Candidatus Bathyarchaeum sp.]
MLTEKRLVLGEETIQLAKALANQSRFKILIQLYSEALTFKKLKQVTGLEKSALANNLHKLLDVNLVKKSQHGIYEITEDGKKLLEALQKLVETSKARKSKLQIANTQHQMMKSFLERNKKES